MATLTGQLQTETRGKSMTAGDAVAPSFVNSIFNVASGAISAFGPMQKRMEAQKTKDALNDAEQAQFDFLNSKEQELNPAYKAAGDELTKAQTAERQGRAPAGSADLRAEKVVSDLYARFPDDKASIAQYLQGRGFDHYMFQAVKQEEKWKELEADSERYLYEKSYQAAVNKGLADPTDDAATVKAGQALLKSEAELEIAIKAGQEARAQASENREQAKWEADKADKDAVNAASNLGGVYLNSIIPKVTAMLSSAQGSEERTKMMGELQPQLRLSVETYRSQVLTKMRSAGATADAINAFNAQVDDRLEAVNTLFDADFEANTRAYNTMKLKFQMDDATALPAYNRVVRLLGQNAANAIFGDDPSSALPQDVVDQLKKEMKGFSTGNANQASVTLSNIVAIREGVKGLNDLTEDEARRVIGSTVKTSLANQQAINRGDLSFGTTSSFLNTQAQVVNAASELQPGTPDIKSINAAVSAVANPTMWQTFIALKKDPSTAQRTEALIIGNRGATAQLLRAAQQSGPDTLGIWSIRFDTRNGTYKVEPDKKKLEAARRNAGPTGVTAVEGMVLPTAGGARSDAELMPPSLKLKADTMNMALNHLWATSGFDDELPKGSTALGLRNWYANGTPPKTATGEKAPSPDELWNKAYNNLRRDVQEIAVTGGASMIPDEAPVASFKGASISPGDAVSRFQRHGVPSHIAQGIVGNLMAESALKTDAVGDGGQAMSLAQWHPNRRADAKKAGFDLTDPQEAIDFVMWELNNTEAEAKRQLSKAKTVQEAADIFALFFLRPAGAQTGRAENVHNIEGRRRYAQGLAKK